MYRSAILARYVFLILLASFSGGLLAQPMVEQVKTAIDGALTTYLKAVYPDNACEENGSAHFYKKNFSITRTQEVSGTLRVWGQANVTYRNSRSGGDAVVEFYAECVKKPDGVVVTRLRWRRGPCMRFVSLLGG
ncbi:MAG: hypothetical protein NWR72_14610 [Bacteroidia bacterium]|nr:hypothetical protein [Bacteroidia bacterium]